MSGWGTGPWGTGPWGSLVGIGNTSVQAAFATSERTVRVVFTDPVVQVSPIGAGDALNPRRWEVLRLDTNRAFTVLTITSISPTTVELYLLQKLGEFGITHRVIENGIQDTNGAFTIAPFSADFLGVSVQKTFGPKNKPMTDLLEHPNSPNDLSGVMRAASTGDYELHSGEELVRKLIIRRLTSRPNSFFHLGPDYGLSLRDKEPLLGRDLGKYKKDIIRQVEEEPDIEAANADVKLSSQGILTILITAHMVNGQIVSVPFQVPTATMNV